MFFSWLPQQRSRTCRPCWPSLLSSGLRVRSGCVLTPSSYCIPTLTASRELSCLQENGWALCARDQYESRSHPLASHSSHRANTSERFVSGPRHLHAAVYTCFDRERRLVLTSSYKTELPRLGVLEGSALSTTSSESGEEREPAGMSIENAHIALLKTEGAIPQTSRSGRLMPLGGKRTMTDSPVPPVLSLPIIWTDAADIVWEEC